MQTLHRTPCHLLSHITSQATEAGNQGLLDPKKVLLGKSVPQIILGPYRFYGPEGAFCDVV